MAYVLGFFTADGNMIRNKRGGYFIEFISIDYDLIEKIRTLLRSDLKISVRKHRNEKWSTCYRLQVGSKEIYHDLLRLGMTPNKSKSVQMPNIPLEYLGHFVRGYFDGDGNVSSGSYARKDRKKRLSKIILSGFISGSKQFLEQFHNSLKNFAGIKGGTLYHHDRAYRLYFSIRDTMALYRFLYANCGALYLLRKRIIFEKYFGPVV